MRLQSRTRRKKIDVSRGIRKNIKKNIAFWYLFASILAPFGIQIGSILGSFFASVFGHISDAFFLKIEAFPIPQILNFGALAYAPCDFSSFHQIANKSKTNATSLQNGSQNQPKNLLKSGQKSMKNHIRFFIDFYLQNGPKMSPKWEGKKWENLALGTLGGQGGPPRSPKGTRGVPEPQKWSPRQPQTPKIDPKRSPQTAQATPRAPKMKPKRPPRQAPELCARRFHDRKNIQTDAKTTNQQATTQTTEIRRPGGMREAIE